MNRICSNDVLSSAADDAPYPVGSAGVKELYDDAGAITGYAVYRKAETGTTGANWYWYEEMGGAVAADGRGNSGVP